MKKILCICSILTAMHFHAFAVPSLVKGSPAPKAPLTTSTSPQAFTLVETVPAAVNPDFLTYSHSGRFVAVTNGGDDSISVYAVDRETGELTQIKGSPFPTGVYPISIAYSPDDAYAAVTNASSVTAGTYRNDSIFVYKVHRETGVFTLIQILTYASNPELVTPVSIAYSPDGRFAAVANYDHIDYSDNIAIYWVSQITGKLTFSTMVPESGNGPEYVAYSPNGAFAAVTLDIQNLVANFQVDPVTGNFFNEVDVATESEPLGVAYSHNGKFAAVANYTSPGSVSTYTVNQVTGVFTPTPASPANAGNNPAYVAYSRDDSLLAVTNTADGTVSVYCVDPTTGDITQTQPVVNNPPPVTIVTTFEASGIDFAPCSDFAAVTSFGDNTSAGSNTVSVFSVNEAVCR